VDLPECYMCKEELKNSACVVASDLGSLILLCDRCEPLVKQIEGSKCDFCSSKNICVSYMCEDIPAEFCNDNDIGIRAMSSGDWVACSECEEVIDKKDLDGLVKRVMSVFTKKQNVSENEKKELTYGLRSLYKVFIEKRSVKEKR
jgi:hypothetical protein